MTRKPCVLGNIIWREAQAMAEAHGAQDWHEAALSQQRLEDAVRLLVNQPTWQPPTDEEAASA